MVDPASKLYYILYYDYPLELAVITTIRLGEQLEQKLAERAALTGRTKSLLIRDAIAAYIAKEPEIASPWEIGKDLFGQFGSGDGDRSTRRKELFKEKLAEKKHGKKNPR